MENNKCKYCERQIGKKQSNQETCSITCQILYKSAKPTPDEKLREAAEKEIEMPKEWQIREPIPQITHGSLCIDRRLMFVIGAKSNASKEYHETMKEKADLSELEKEIKDQINYANLMAVDSKRQFKEFANFIWGIFLPHLQPQSSDAVEFAEWISKNEYKKQHHSTTYWTSGLGFDEEPLIVQDLYKKFKQSKNK